MTPLFELTILYHRCCKNELVMKKKTMRGGGDIIIMDIFHN